MTFYQYIGIDILLAVIFCLHIMGCFFTPRVKRILAAVNVALHALLVLCILQVGCAPEEALLLMLASALFALCLGICEERGADK